MASDVVHDGGRSIAHVSVMHPWPLRAWGERLTAEQRRAVERQEIFFVMHQPPLVVAAPPEDHASQRKVALVNLIKWRAEERDVLKDSLAWDSERRVLPPAFVIYDALLVRVCVCGPLGDHERALVAAHQALVIAAGKCCRRRRRRHCHVGRRQCSVGGGSGQLRQAASRCAATD